MSEDLTRSENDLRHCKESVIANLAIKLQRAESNYEEVENELIKAENEIRSLKRQMNNNKPASYVLDSMNEIETRVRRQSMMETSGRINGLEEAIKVRESSNKEMKAKIEDQDEQIFDLTKENKKLKKEIQTANDNNERIQGDVELLNKMKAEFEVEFSEVVDKKDNEVRMLSKQLQELREEYGSLLRNKKDLEGKLTIFKLKSNSSSPERKPFEKGDERIDTSHTNEDDALRIDGEESQESDNEVIFDDLVHEVDYKPEENYENLGEFIGNRNSYYGRDTYNFNNGGEQIQVMDDPEEDDLERMVDEGTQTIQGYSSELKLNLKPVEEEKYSLNGYSMEIRSPNSNFNDSTLSTPRSSPRKDALEEYFRMTVLANKIAHQDLDKV